MVCHLYGTDPLYELMLAYCQVDLKEHILMIFYLKGFSFKKMHWKIVPTACRLFCPGPNVLRYCVFLYSHDASDKYPTLHHFVKEMCTRVYISETKILHCRIWDWCIAGFVQHRGLSLLPGMRDLFDHITLVQGKIVSVNHERPPSLQISISTTNIICYH